MGYKPPRAATVAGVQAKGAKELKGCGGDHQCRPPGPAPLERTARQDLSHGPSLQDSGLSSGKLQRYAVGCCRSKPPGDLSRSSLSIVVIKSHYHLLAGWNCLHAGPIGTDLGAGQWSGQGQQNTYPDQPADQNRAPCPGCDSLRDDHGTLRSRRNSWFSTTTVRSSSAPEGACARMMMRPGGTPANSAFPNDDGDVLGRKERWCNQDPRDLGDRAIGQGKIRSHTPQVWIRLLCNRRAPP